MEVYGTVMNNINIVKRNQDFALIELPLVLLFLCIIGLCVAVLVRSFTGALAWYWWLFAGLCLPVLAIGYGVLALLSDPIRKARRGQR